MKNKNENLARRLRNLSASTRNQFKDTEAVEGYVQYMQIILKDQSKVQLCDPDYFEVTRLLDELHMLIIR